MRQRHKPWADDFIEENRHLLMEKPEENKNKWKLIFKNDNPIHLEIGTGKGQFLVGMARNNPEINFIGVELSKSVIVTAAEKIIDSEQKNIKLLNMDANNLLDVFGISEIDTIYLNFSDPWPKNRHEKRRLTFHAFLETYKTILIPDGEMVMKTDNRGLFEYSLESFSKFNMLLKRVNLDLHQENDPDNVMTEYEEKFSKRGQVIYRCQAQF